MLVEDLLEIGGEAHSERLAACHQGQRSSQILHDEVRGLKDSVIVSIVSKVLEDQFTSGDERYRDGPVNDRWQDFHDTVVNSVTD